MRNKPFTRLAIATVVGLTLTIAIVAAAAAQEPGKFYAGLTQYKVSPWERVQISGCEADDNQLVYVTVYQFSPEHSTRHLELATDHGCFRGEFQAPSEAGTFRVWVRQYAGGGLSNKEKNVTLLLTVVSTEQATTQASVPPTPTSRPIVAPMELAMTLPMAAETGSVVTVTLAISPANVWPMQMSFQIGSMGPLEWKGGNITQTVTFTPAVAGTYPVTVTVANKAGEALITGTLVVTGETFAVAPVIGLAPTGGSVPVGPRINPLAFLAAILMAIVVVGAVVGIRHWASGLVRNK